MDRNLGGLPIQDDKFATVLSVYAPTLQAETGVVLLPDWLPTKAAEPSLPKGCVVVQKEPSCLLREVPDLRPLFVA